MLALQVAKAKGVKVIAVDKRQVSLDLASTLGADEIINSDISDVKEVLGDITNGEGPDVVLDAAGGESTVASAVEWVRPGGKVVLVAIYVSLPQFDFNSLVGREKEVLGSIAFRRQDVKSIIGLIASGDVQTEPLISTVISLEEGLEVGFPQMMARTKDVFRILVSPGGIAQ